MKLKFIITVMALTAACISVHAQEKKTNPNPWFIQGQMGASYSTVDGLMNLSQLIKKYPERLFDLSIIAGVGFNRTYSHNVSSFMGRLGLQGAFRLNDTLDFNIEALANGVSDRWNGRDDHSFDTYFTLSLGLT